MNKPLIIEFSKKLIAEGRLSEAIQLLLTSDAKLSSRDQNSIIMLSGSLKNITRDRLLNTPDYYDRRINQIQNGLLETLSSINTFSEITLPKNSSEELEKIIGSNSLEPIVNLRKQITWLQQGIKASKSICKIKLNNGGMGTGFIAMYKSEKYLFTNHHVLRSQDIAGAAKLIFNFEQNERGDMQKTSEYSLIPETYVFSPSGNGPQNLDYACVKVKGLDDKWGYLNLNINESSFAPETRIAIIQHPRGGMKQISLKGAKIESVQEKFRIYHTADTEPGSSGSPIFDMNWEVIGLHYASDRNKPLNVGIFFKYIVEDLEKRS